jgi:hypothetical protein
MKMKTDFSSEMIQARKMQVSILKELAGKESI